MFASEKPTQSKTFGQNSEAYRINISKIDEKTLIAMLGKDSGDRQFVVALTDFKAGNPLEKGEIEPLTPQQTKDNAKKIHRNESSVFKSPIEKTLPEKKLSVILNRLTARSLFHA